MLQRMARCAGLSVSGWCAGFLGLFDGLNLDFCDAPAFHFDHGEAAVVVVDRLTGARNVAEAGEHESGEGFNTAIARQTPLHLGFQIAEVGAALENERALGVGENGASGVVELIFELTS